MVKVLARKRFLSGVAVALLVATAGCSSSSGTKSSALGTSSASAASATTSSASAAASATTSSASAAVGPTAASSAPASATNTSSSPATAKATITVGDLPTANQAATRAVFQKDVQTFEAQNPGITVKATETTYDPSTFQSLLAGGNLPTVMGVPFTQPQGLIARGQIADLTSQIAAAGLTGQLNQRTLGLTSAGGKNYGIPSAAYSVGLVYNRDLFTQAGLDPNKPPTTWDEVAADAKQIVAKTGQAGYAQMSGGDGCGGWIFSAMTYSLGGKVESDDGKQIVVADTPAAKQALDLIHKLKWDDKVMNGLPLIGCNNINQLFAAGKIGMYIKAADDYGPSTVQFKMKPEAFGAGGFPGVSGVAPATLSGGTVQVVNAKATDAQKAAAVKWVKFHYLRQYLDQSTALAVAKAAAADGAPVAIPGLPVVSDAAYTNYFSWISSVNNVPINNFQPYVNAAKTQKIFPEPPNDAAKVYSAFDAIVQAVLTNQNADPQKLLTDAQRTVTPQLGR